MRSTASGLRQPHRRELNTGLILALIANSIAWLLIFRLLDGAR